MSSSRPIRVPQVELGTAAYPLISGRSPFLTEVMGLEGLPEVEAGVINAMRASIERTDDEIAKLQRAQAFRHIVRKELEGIYVP